MLDYEQVNALQARWMELYNRMAEQTVRGDLGKGVAVVMDGQYRALAVEVKLEEFGIKPEQLPPGAAARLQEELANAFNAAVAEAGQAMAKLAQSLDQEPPEK